MINPNINKQQGAVLIVSLLMLLVMTIIGLSAMRSTTLEEKMAGNYRNNNIAFQAAEAALRDGENDVASIPCSTGCARSPLISGLNDFDSGCSYGLCAGWSPTIWKDTTKMAKAVSFGTYTGATSIPEVASPPAYLVEGRKCMGPGWQSWKYCYRITAIGYGGTQSAQRVLQEVYTLP